VLSHLRSKLSRFLRRRRLRREGASIGSDLQSFDEFFRGAAAGFTCFRRCYISAGARIIVAERNGVIARLSIGSDFFINHYSIVDCHDSITIGSRVLIGPFAYIGDFDHCISSEHGQRAIGATSPIRIEDDVWVGAHACVLKGVTIGKGAIIAAGAVVTSDIPPHTLAAGIPARAIKSIQTVANV